MNRISEAEKPVNVQSTHYTIAEYSEQFNRGEILVDRTYQRTNKVWPPAARSYLIDSILERYPISKILLRPQTNLSTRKTTKHVIDGQQRTQAIIDFLNDKFSITLRQSEHYGRRFSTLPEDDQLEFLNYPISADIFLAATDEQIREVFRRLNSYNVPLNKQELRHATHQGDFKWFVHGLTTKYADTLKRMRIVSESQISRMMDAEFFTNILAAMRNGIETGSPKKLDDLYRELDNGFPEREEYERFLDHGVADLIQHEELIVSTKLHSRHITYSMILAFGNAHVPLDPLIRDLDFDPSGSLRSSDNVKYNLSQLAEALDEWDEYKEQSEGTAHPRGPFARFVTASSEGTNTATSRKIRFQWFSRALLPNRLP